MLRLLFSIGLLEFVRRKEVRVYEMQMCSTVVNELLTADDIIEHAGQ